jgi:hypothetical protein
MCLFDIFSFVCICLVLENVVASTVIITAFIVSCLSDLYFIFWFAECYPQKLKLANTCLLTDVLSLVKHEICDHQYFIIVRNKRLLH